MNSSDMTESRTGVYLRKLSNGPQDLSDQSVCSAKRRINPGTDTNESTGNSKLEKVILRMKRHNSAENGLAFVPALIVLGNDTWSNFNFLPQPQNTSQDRSTSDTSLEIVDFSTWLVDIERTDNNQPGIGGEVTNRNRNSFHDVFIDSINVVF